METILIIAVVGTLNVVCFFVGAKVGQTVAKDKEIEVPKISSPVALYKAHREAKEAEAEKNRLDVIMANIERYDGTEAGQEDVPRG